MLKNTLKKIRGRAIMGGIVGLLTAFNSIYVFATLIASYPRGAFARTDDATAQVFEEERQVGEPVVVDAGNAAQGATGTPAQRPEPRVGSNRGSGGSNGGGLPAQWQKDATERICRRIAAARADMLNSVNVSPELFLDTCYYDLLAMSWAESRFVCTVIGDQGRSRGCFQIQTALHGVSVEQAENYEWAAEWTVDRMVRDTSYPHLRTASITRHNGSGPAAAAYAASVKAKAEEFRKMGL